MIALAMVSIVEQDKMLLAFAAASEKNSLSHDNEACPSNLSPSTAGSSTGTNMSADDDDDMAALQAATAQVKLSASEQADKGYDARDGASYYRMQQQSSASLMMRHQQPSQDLTWQQQQNQRVTTKSNDDLSVDRNTESSFYSWSTTTVPPSIVDPFPRGSHDVSNSITASHVANSNLSMRDMFEDNDAVLECQQNQKAPSETTMWFPLAENEFDDGVADGGASTPNVSSGGQTPQHNLPQKMLPSPPSTLSQMTFLQEHSPEMDTAVPPSLPAMLHSPAYCEIPPGDETTAVQVGTERQDSRPKGYSRVAHPNPATARRPVLYSAIGSLENASLQSWDKRLQINAAKKASPFVTNRKNQELPSTAWLLPPNQWVPLTSQCASSKFPASTTSAATETQNPTSTTANSTAPAVPSSVSSSASSSNSHRQKVKQHSLASVLAAAEEAARSASGSQTTSPEMDAGTSPQLGYTASPGDNNATVAAEVPSTIGVENVRDGQNESLSNDPGGESEFKTGREANSDPPVKTDFVETISRNPILNSALRPSRIQGKANSDEQKHHKRPYTMWGLNLFDDKSKGRHVTLDESPATSIKKKKKRKKKVVEMFRPSCDAYTPRINTEKRAIKYKPAQERRAMIGGNQKEDMGTLSRPNFRDALRRVAMIVHQHVVKIEHRVEDQGGLLNKGLFTAEMREAFSEERFVTPRYKCTMVRVPMSRPGMVYGLRKIKVRYEIPTESEIYEFAHRLFQKVQLSSECSIVGLIYVERLMEIAKVPLLADTWRPIFLCGLLLASKVWQDLSSWNIEFASVYPQFSLKAIHQLELQFLRMVKWDLYISSSLYAKYYFALRSLVEKRDFRQRYNRMVGGVGNVDASQALQIQKRTEMVKEEALLQLSRSM